MIKAAFFDLDGTLLSHSMGCIPASTLRALEILEEKRIKVFLATGRHISEVCRFLGRNMEFEGMITLNGQVCLNSGGYAVLELPLRQPDLDTIVQAFRSKEFPIILVEREQMYINYIDDYVVRAQQEISSPLPRVGEYTGGRLFQAVLYGDPGRLQEFTQRLVSAKINWWNPVGVDVIDDEGGKAHGVKWFIDAYGIAPEEIIAFGDGQNDVEMLRMAGIGVAMGNAMEETKQAADYVTDHIDRDGVYNALAHFGLI